VLTAKKFFGTTDLTPGFSFVCGVSNSDNDLSFFSSNMALLKKKDSRFNKWDDIPAHGAYH